LLVLVLHGNGDFQNHKDYTILSEVSNTFLKSEVNVSLMLKLPINLRFTD
jgi:hypothetical protein